MKTAEHIIETVDKLVRKYHTRDPYELCQLLGIKIHYYDLQKKLKGFFYYQSRQKNIVIDHNVNGILERILVAHELGHAVLHTKIAMMHGFQEMEASVYKGYKQDKIEMRGDRAEMSDFPLYLNTVAGGLDRRDQTIGGFSFVVKIYAVPVVEIIGYIVALRCGWQTGRFCGMQTVRPGLA